MKKSLTLFTLFISFISGTLSAKEWVMLPASGRGALRVGTLLTPAQSVETGSIPALRARRLHTSGTVPPASAEGFVVEELAPVHSFSADPRLAEQWTLAEISAQQAWAKEAPGDGVLVAVLDTGVDATHPDLAGKVVGGANFIDGGSWNDDHWHGTFCASLIAAVRDNGIGMAGVAGSARILAGKVLDKNGQGYDYNVAQGIVWSADAGARVISISLGGSSPSAVMEAAVQYAISKGVLIVAASGNDGSSTVFYPASIPGVLSVGSNSSRGARAPYSSYNSFVSMVAPGGDGDGVKDVLGAVPGGAYSMGSGTSFAAPMVAAAAAAYFHTFPGVGAAQAFADLTGTAMPLSADGAWSPETGWGELNVAALLKDDVSPRVYNPVVVNATVIQSSPAPGVGAFAATPRNSQVAAAYAVLKDGDLEVQRQMLSQQAASSLQWLGGLAVPEWNGLSARTLQVYYQAQNSAGALSPMVAAGAVIQQSRYTVNFEHEAPARLAVGQPYSARLVQTPARPTCSGWTMQIKNADGSVQSVPGVMDADGALIFSVPGSLVAGRELDYSFHAVDSEGKGVVVHGGKDYQVALFMPGAEFQARPYANPGASLCLRVTTAEASEGAVLFYNTAGELVGRVQAQLNPGENLVCLDSTVASGMYIAVAKGTEGQGSKFVKLAIRR